MELNIESTTVCASETVYDSVVEQPIECDVSLPDYCPDILKILTCTAEASFTLVQAVGATVALDGHTCINIVYLSEDGSLHTSEHRIPFSRTIELKSSVENAVVYYTVEPGYINCRAVSRRRADVRGAFNINLKVISQKREKVIKSAQGAGIQLLKNRETVSETVGSVCRCTTVKDEVEIPKENDSVREIIRCSCTAKATDCKAISNKIISKGELSVNILYTGNNSEKDFNTFSFTIPISQIADMENVDESCRCDVRFKAVSCEITEHSGTENDARKLSVEAVFCAEIKAYRDDESEVVSDCYSTMYDCNFNSKSISCIIPIKSLCETVSLHNEIKMPENAVSADDVRCKARFCKIVEKDSGAVLSGKLTVCMLARDNENEIMYCENELDFECDCIESIPIQELSADINATATSLRYRLDGNILKLDAEALLEGTVNRIIKRNALCEIAVDEEKGRKPQSRSAITIYFADKGESVWEIAKKYNTSADAVTEENSLEENFLSKRSMLLIPIVL